MLHAPRQHRDLRENALVCWASHDLSLVSLAAAIWADDGDCWAKEFEVVPAGASDGEDVGIIGDIAENLKSGMMSEKEVRVDSDATNVLENVGELHIIGIRAEAVEADI